MTGRTLNSLADAQPREQPASNWNRPRRQGSCSASLQSGTRHYTLLTGELQPVRKPLTLPIWTFSDGEWDDDTLSETASIPVAHSVTSERILLAQATGTAAKEDLANAAKAVAHSTVTVLGVLCTPTNATNGKRPHAIAVHRFGASRRLPRRRVPFPRPRRRSWTSLT